MIELKPCPACGSEAVITGCGGVRAICGNWDCQMTGPRKMVRDDAAAVWNALPRPLRWTKEPPTEPGWYFFRGNIPGYQENNPPVYVDVQKDAVILTRHAPWILSKLIDKYAIEWAGPIQEPVD